MDVPSSKASTVFHYRFGIFTNEKGGSTIIVLDSFLQLQAVNNMLRITVTIFLACILIVFALLLVLSKRAIRPFVDNLERQRQFITDASHELKTPLAILSADMGLLEDTYGGDKWLESAKSQITRLDKLIKDLVELARTEETIKEDTVEVFSVSEIARASADAFQPLAEADGKSLTVEITDGIIQKGVPDNFFRLFSILLDNAVKYCNPAGTIHLSVSLRGRNIHNGVLPSLRIFLLPPTTTFNARNGTFFWSYFQKFCSPRANKETGYIHNRTSRTAQAPLVFILVCVCNRLYLYQSDQPIQLALP